MKRFVTATLVVLLALFLYGCGTKSYQVVTKSGQTYTTQGKVDYDVQSKTYSFKNQEGREVILNQADIEVIQESSEE